MLCQCCINYKDFLNDCFGNLLWAVYTYSTGKEIICSMGPKYSSPCSQKSNTEHILSQVKPVHIIKAICLV